jgi:hypothetical protein
MRAASNYPFFHCLSPTCESEISPSTREPGNSSARRRDGAHRDSRPSCGRSACPSRTPNAAAFRVSVRRGASGRGDDAGVEQEWMTCAASYHRGPFRAEFSTRCHGFHYGKLRRDPQRKSEGGEDRRSADHAETARRLCQSPA